MVSVAQSVWSLSIGLCYQISHLPEERLWDVVVLAPRALRVGQFRDTGVPNGPWKGTAGGGLQTLPAVVSCRSMAMGVWEMWLKWCRRENWDRLWLLVGFVALCLLQWSLAPGCVQPASAGVLSDCLALLSHFSILILLFYFFYFYSDRKQNR